MPTPESTPPLPLTPYPDMGALLAAWPPDQDIIALGGGGRFAILALDWEELDGADVAAMTWQGASASQHADGLPFHTGIVGVLPYDAVAGCGAQGIGSRYFAVKSALVLDQEARAAFITGSPLGAQILRQRLDRARASVAQTLVGAEPLNLVPHHGDAAYLAMVEGALADIRAGLYYQINLLRYFSLPRPVDPRSLARRFAIFGGPYSAWVRVPGLELISFSPERFINIHAQGESLRVTTHPIKGTAKRSHDPEIDRQLREALASSRKDAAELAMIVDLMRNDLNRLAIPGTVVVTDPGSLASFRGVHHRVATIEAELPRQTTFGGLCAALCPGGSITGAPKRAAMQAIRVYEGRNRGAMMGHVFYWDRVTGRFDSSILIRTMQRVADGAYEYAAGSGIVIASDPKVELGEITAKCRVLTDRVP